MAVHVPSVPNVVLVAGLNPVIALANAPGIQLESPMELRNCCTTVCSDMWMCGGGWGFDSEQAGGDEEGEKHLDKDCS